MNPHSPVPYDINKAQKRKDSVSTLRCRVQTTQSRRGRGRTAWSKPGISANRGDGSKYVNYPSGAGYA